MLGCRLLSPSTTPPTSTRWTSSLVSPSLVSECVWVPPRETRLSNLLFSTAEVSNFIQENTNWVRSMSESTNTTDYAIQVSLVLKQLDGIVDGYNAYAPNDERLSYWDMVAWQLQVSDLSEANHAAIGLFIDTSSFFSFFFIVSWKDELGDIYPAVQSNVEHPFAKTRKQLLYSDHCSVLIKPTAGNESLFSSHVTWSGYASMLRTYKVTDTDGTISDLVLTNSLSNPSIPTSLSPESRTSHKSLTLLSLVSSQGDKKFI